MLRDMVCMEDSLGIIILTITGYKAMVVKAYDYDTHGAPISWSKIFAMRHALSKYPDCKFVWYLDQDAYIMDLNKSLESQLVDTKKLESLMIKDHAVVPPDSIIKTFAHLKGGDVNFMVSQDNHGMISDSVVIRNGDWAKFFTETWMDPLYRSYNFQKAERHALVSTRPASRAHFLTQVGTHRPVAPYHPLQTRPSTAKDLGFLHPRQPRCILPRR